LRGSDGGRGKRTATAKILDGAAAARIYYFEHNDSYKGMRDTDLGDIEESVDFRMAPGRTARTPFLHLMSRKDGAMGHRSKE